MAQASRMPREAGHPSSRGTASATTRVAAEARDEDGGAFARKPGDVPAECRRVLEADGVLDFSYRRTPGPNG